MDLIVLVPVAGVAAVLFALWLARDVLSRDTGTPEMQQVAGLIFEGAMAFLKRQYGTIGIMTAIIAVVLMGVVSLVSDGVKEIKLDGTTIVYGDVVMSSTKEGLLTGIAFVVGALCSAVSGYIGMYIAVRSNLRTAAAARNSLKDAITVALRGGAVSGFLVVALSLIGVSTMWVVYTRVLGYPEAITPFLIVGFGFGASFVALFAQIGGGIYTKAADVGADLVGKVEAGIPEDDPRNAAVIADLVGDNVGDCAGRGADLFESMSAENIGAMILGVAIYTVTQDLNWILFPLVLRSFGVFATIIGMMVVPMFSENAEKDPMRPLNMGYYVVSALSIVGLYIATSQMLGDSWMWFFWCGVTGIACGFAFVYITQYYTAGAWRPVKEIAEASKTGPATNIIIGTSVGLETFAPSAVAIVLALVISYTLGSNAEIANVPAFTTGIFGTAVATMGMLMSAAYILSMDTFGPITDNAGGIAEFSGAPASARHITDALDTVGNTTKALTKGYAVASAGLAAFLLFSAYLDKVKERLDIPLVTELPIDLASIDVFAGGVLGVTLVFLFSALTIRAVGSAASSIIEEVRRQFREHPGIMNGTERPDYARAVDITARAALRQMVAPGVLVVSAPIVVGLVFRYLRDASVTIYSHDAKGVLTAIEYPHSSGWLAVSGMLIIGTIGGIAMATFFNNSGGAWDNAKKYIESGDMKDENGEVVKKGSAIHAAAVVGDTVGDPFKDTAGPSLHVLVKLLATVTLVLAPLFIAS
ncbi:MAG: sodium-translocating pyrophosphatase [Dehalococcoidia bacterium]|nr:MAG: sodium-translocating pyrophosphatase [Dehalococcoidia bacterium]